MTNRSVTKGSVNADETGKAMKDKLIADKKVSNKEDSQLTMKKKLTEIASVPANWNDMTVRQQSDWVYSNINDHCANFPESLHFMYLGCLINGDNGQSSGVMPEWLDREKFERGQRFAMNNLAAVTMSEFFALHILFTFENGLKPFIFTGKSGEPYTSFRRYLSTAKRMKSWYTSDLWTQGTVGQRELQTVRRMHANVRKRMADKSCDEIIEATTIRNTWSKNNTEILEDFKGSCPVFGLPQYPTKSAKAINQFDMSGTQFGFTTFIILYPEKFGVHGASYEDLEAFCHMWRGLGYLLGIDDEFNFCKGSFEEVKERSRDVMEYVMKPNLRNVTPEWEHMLRCLAEGIKYYFPIITYEQSLLYLAEVLDVDMPRLQASLSYPSWIHYNFLKFALNWIARLPGVQLTLSRCLAFCTDRAVNYTNEELDVLRKKSEIALSKGLAETIAAQKNLTEKTTTSAWKKTPLFVFLTSFLLISLPIIVKEYAGKIIHIGSGLNLRNREIEQ